MRFYILNSFRDIQCQNVLETFGTPCIVADKKKQLADLIRNMIFKATKSSEKNIASLNYQLDELKNSQSFVSRKHDDLAGDYGEILQTNK